MKYKEIVKNKEINAYLEKGNANLGQLGFTDHSQAHCVQVAHQAGKILERFGYSEHEVELVKIAGYMHDIGNAINRTHHAEYGALLANDLLKDTDMSLEDRITVMSAIGNHDESTGDPEDVISAALIIADKTDVRRSRVRQKEQSAFDIHDRVNYAVTDSKLKIAKDRSVIALNLQIDENICTMFEYFDIFNKERGTAASNEMFKFFDRGNNTLVLRPDMTPAIARCVAKYFREETEQMRFCYTAQTFVSTGQYKGKLQEVTQVGAELFMDDSSDADAEMLALTIECLLESGLKEFQIEVGHADLFRALVEEAGFEEETIETLRDLIESKNFFGVEELLGKLTVQQDRKSVV